MMRVINFLRIKQFVQNIFLSGMILYVTGCIPIPATMSVIKPDLPLLIPERIISTTSQPQSLLVTPTNIVLPFAEVTPQFSSPTSTRVNSLPVTATPILKPVILDSKKWEHIIMPSEGTNVAFYQIAQAEDGTMWFLGYSDSGKIYRYDFKDWTIYDPKNISAFHNTGVNSLAVTPDGTVWFGTNMNEIVSFDGKRWISQPVEEGGYRENYIVSILTRKNGELCAISIEGLSCKKNEGQWIRHPIVNQNKTGRVSSIQKAIVSPTDEIWVSLSYGWLYHYDGKNWENSQISNWIGSIAYALDGSLWIFDYEGLGKRAISGKISFIEYPYALEVDSPQNIYEAKDGTVWLGCLGGGRGYQIIRYKNGVFETVDNKIINIRYDSTYFNSQYPFGDIYDIFQSKDNSIWFATENGIFRYHSN
jgi:ligand-binding sensor domain-containing protein